jgi:chorismate mutase-like protein
MEAHEKLEKFRAELDAIDTQVIEVLARRFRTCCIIADYKRKNGINMMQPHRILSVKQRTAKMGAERGISVEFLDKLYDLIIEEACRIEIDVMETEMEPDK